MWPSKAFKGLPGFPLKGSQTPLAPRGPRTIAKSTELLDNRVPKEKHVKGTMSGRPAILREQIVASKLTNVCAFANPRMITVKWGYSLSA